MRVFRLENIDYFSDGVSGMSDQQLDQIVQLLSRIELVTLEWTSNEITANFVKHHQSDDDKF